jgi:hypothetical protein
VYTHGAASAYVDTAISPIIGLSEEKERDDD